MGFGLDTIAFAEQAGQSGVRDRDVESVGIIVANIFPVHVTRSQSDAAEGFQFFEFIRRNLIFIGRHHLGHGGSATLQPDKNETAPDFHVDGNQPCLILVQGGIGSTVRNARQAAIQIIGPRMIGAHKLFRAAARSIDKPGTAVTADIGKSTKRMVRAAHDDNALPYIIEAVPIARIRNVADMANHLPCRAKDTLNLNFRKFRIIICPCWKAPALQCMRVILRGLNGHIDSLVVRVYNNCMSPRQVFTRESADIRKEALIAACAHCLATLGAQGTSVRSICVEAGVSPGLLRHYFDGIDALVAATYRETGARVAKALHKAVEAVPPENPRGRLLAFVTASFREPIADPELLATWIAFWSLSRADPAIGRIHGEIYADNRRDIEKLIAACPGTSDDPRLTAVALTALVDGLWLELSLGNAPFSVDEAEALAEKWLDSLLA